MRSSTKSTRVLVIEDDEIVASLIAHECRKNGFQPIVFDQGRTALLHPSDGVSAVLIDLSLPDLSGMDILREMKRKNPNVPCFIITASDTASSAIEALKSGAIDYFTKPINMTRLVESIKSAAASSSIPGPTAFPSSSTVHGKSPLMTKLQRLVSKASRSSSPALIIGESGTGKAELASSIHFGSPRRGSPFVVYNASTDSAQQIEIDLFGSDGGVSTTLRSNMRGKIEAAAKGTLFINEIENLPASVQWKLIEVLDTWTFSRFGCEVKRRLDLHLVFGTSENLPGDPDSSGLNAELLSRISAFTLRIPALRDRSEDIPILCEHYITQICIANCRRRPEISADAMNLLVAYQWPGNLVELKSALEHAVALADNDMIDARDLPETIARLDQTGIDYNPASRNIGGRTINELERLSLMEALESCNGNRRKVAERLGVSLRTVYNLMDRYGISRDRRPSQEEAGNVS